MMFAATEEAAVPAAAAAPALAPAVIELVIDRAAFAGNGPDLDVFAKRHPGTAIAFRTAPATQFPPLLTLFRRWTNTGGTGFASAAMAPAKAATPRHVGLSIDFAGGDSAAANSDRIWRVTYDGKPGERALFATLLSGRAPLVEIVDRASNRIVASGKPCVNDAGNLDEAAAFVRARALDLIAKAIASPDAAQSVAADAVTGTDIPNALIVKAAARRVAHRLARAAYRRLFYTPQWRVGYRFVEGDGVLERGSLAGEAWRSLPEVQGHFYADPFPIVVDGQHYIFFEDLDHKSYKGTISYVRLAEDGTPGPVMPALEVAHHLSYPFLLQQDGEIFMLPEQCVSGELAIYRAEAFPDTWVKHAVLLSGVDISDATILQRDGRYWIFATMREGNGSPSDALAVFYADKLMGPWTPHAMNPILIDKTAARPAGPFVERDGKLFRIAQDGTFGYGSGLSIIEVTQLSTERVEQTVLQKVWPGSPQWPGKRLHTLARAGNLECIDGEGLAARAGWLRTLLQWPAARRFVERLRGVRLS